MLRCASSLVVATYGKVRLTPRILRALPAAFLRSRPKFKAFATYYEVGKLERNYTTDIPVEIVKKAKELLS